MTDEERKKRYEKVLALLEGMSRENLDILNADNEDIDNYPQALKEEWLQAAAQQSVINIFLDAMCGPGRESPGTQERIPDAGTF